MKRHLIATGIYYFFNGLYYSAKIEFTSVMHSFLEGEKSFEGWLTMHKMRIGGTAKLPIVS